MIGVNIVTTICLIAFFVEIAYVVRGLKGKSLKEQITYVRGFKKVNFLAIYITAFPLFHVGIKYAEHDFWNSIFMSIKSTIDLIVLKYDVASIEQLICDNLYYRLVIYFCFVLSGFNTAAFAASIFIQQIWCKVQRKNALKSEKDKLYIFGHNPENIAVFNSDKEAGYKVIIDDISKDDCEALYLEQIAYISTKDIKKEAADFVKGAAELDRKYTFVINTNNDEKNIEICVTIVDELRKISDKEDKEIFTKIHVYVFGDPRYQTIYEDVVSSGFGCIHYMNKHQMIAVDFIDRYPLALFMNEKHIDYKTSLVRDGININVALIGFGKTNQQIFLTSVANNQFLTGTEDNPVLKKVKYYIFDKNTAENNKNLNHSYYRYENEFETVKSADYLPLPSKPADLEYIHLDINSKDFYHKIKERVATNPDDANFIVIAFGSDLENLDMAQKLVEKRMEWGVHNLVIFVKVRAWHKEQTLLEDSGCYFIGNENDVVYHIGEITGDKLHSMAKMRDEIHKIEDKITHNPEKKNDRAYIEDISKQCRVKWYVTNSQIDRESSLYCCLSLRSKLNLIGLDYCPVDANDSPALTEEEYLEIYAGSDRPTYGEVIINGKKICCYGIDFAKSLRRTLAIQEHLRWNSFMISKGVIPATRTQILKERREGGDYSNGKNPKLRRHGNLTTYEGLLEFRRMIDKRDGCGEEMADVIKYDYQILDEAHWLLSTNGFKIIKKKDIV